MDDPKGHVSEVSLAVLQNDEVAFRKFKLITEDVQGKNCLTNFHGVDLTVPPWSKSGRPCLEPMLMPRLLMVIRFTCSELVLLQH